MAYKIPKSYEKRGKGKDVSYSRKGYGGLIFIGKNEKGWYFEHGQREYFDTKKQAEVKLKKHMEKYN